MPSSEYIAWAEYARVEPFGDTRLNIHFSQLLALTANIHRKKGSQPVKPNEFMWKDNETRKKENMQSLVAGLRQRAKRKEK